MGEFDSESVSFNMAVASLQRMDFLLREAIMAARNKDGITWFEVVHGLYREVNPYMSTKKRAEENVSEKDYHETWMNNLEKKYLIYRQGLSNYDLATKMYPRFRNYQFVPPNDLLAELHRFEISIRGCMKRHNMLIPSKDDMFAPEEAW